MSRVLGFFLQHILRYRRNVVRRNLAAAFPDKDRESRKRIERDFYTNLASLPLQIICGALRSRKSMKRHMRFENLEPLRQSLQERDATLYLGHIGCWEWVSSLPMHLPKNIVAAQIYKPFNDTHLLERLMLRIRSRFGALSLPMANSLRTLVRLKEQGKRVITGYIADQGPTRENIHLWLPFLNQDTPVYTGAERVGRRLDTSAWYLDIRRAFDGGYIGTFIPIAPRIKDESEGDVTRRYFRLLEENILREPALWLWSHRRWKRAR